MNDFTLRPEIFGTVQPQAGLLTRMIISTMHPGQVTMFITNNESFRDQVRVLLLPAGVSNIQDSQYICYDTPIVAGHSVNLSNIFINQNDQIWVYSTQGATAFTVSGTAFVYD